MRRALFVVDDRPEAGRGHAVRCGALSDELRSRGWESIGGSLDSWSVDPVDVVVIDAPRDAPRWHSLAPLVPGDFQLVVVVDFPRENDDADLLVCGSAGATLGMFQDCGAKRILSGPEYALLRPEFSAVSWGQHGFSSSQEMFDLRTVERESAYSLATTLAASRSVISYGGMRAMEAACVGTPFVELIARNEGERLNVAGLCAGAKVDGLGCRRVADAIEELAQ